MITIQVEVPDVIGKKFIGQKIVKIEDLLEYNDSLSYEFSDEKVTLNELSDFLGKNIESKNLSIC